MRGLVIIPTYNEAPNIETVLERIRDAAPDLSVLVVDDGSPDGTAELADALGSTPRHRDRLTVLRRTSKDGLGRAYCAGFQWGLERSFDVLIEMDADLSHDPIVLPTLLQRIETGADLAIGSRWVAGGSVIDWPWQRRALSRLGNWYASFMLRMRVRDATAGFRAYRADVLRSIDLDRVRANGYAFQVELAYRVHRRGGTIVEVPITFRERTAGVSKMSWHIIGEALTLVTRLGIRDGLRDVAGRFRRRRP